MLTRISCIILLLFPLVAAAQNVEAMERDTVPDDRNMNETIVPGELRIFQDKRIDDLIHRHVQLNAERGGLDGYRIQIYFGSGAMGREEANEHHARALSYFPELKVHLIYQYSYYKVRIGDFRTREEAFRWHQKVKRRFPNAYIVPDIIIFPRIDL
ncbi:MAG TPA: SPOR domain-containing protein [Bacteroidetes bacterium]|nr:SPOR domain-containing protein [Bacteroidota bacterium]